MSREPLNIALAIAAVLLLATGGAWLVDHARQPRLARSTLPASVPAGARKVTLEVSGMYCASCASRITSELQGIGGVQACDVDPAAKRVWVICDHAVADSTLVTAVVRAGTGASGRSEYLARVVRR